MIGARRLCGARAGTRFIFGRVCHRHPEENGRRYEKNGKCVKCQLIKAAEQQQRARTNVVALLRRTKALVKAQRKRRWELNDGQALWLLVQPCIYCGAPSEPGRFGGLDRAKNDFQYEPLNTVSCCWKCNELKGPRDVREFITICCTIAARHANYEMFKVMWEKIREELECRS